MTVRVYRTARVTRATPRVTPRARPGAAAAGPWSAATRAWDCPLTCRSSSLHATERFGNARFAVKRADEPAHDAGVRVRVAAAEKRLVRSRRCTGCQAAGGGTRARSRIHEPGVRVGTRRRHVRWARSSHSTISALPRRSAHSFARRECPAAVAGIEHEMPDGEAVERRCVLTGGVRVREPAVGHRGGDQVSLRPAASPRCRAASRASAPRLPSSPCSAAAAARHMPLVDPARAPPRARPQARSRSSLPMSNGSE